MSIVTINPPGYGNMQPGFMDNINNRERGEGGEKVGRHKSKNKKVQLERKNN